ncbi:type I-F CRISPR-associated endonuclease Cas1f [Gemmatimonas sp.]|uniref:type I-F CRISPR-associated endonuclease Cas1f n=1 Tax=Gemmatimonas sp. TaxID=1962908 RepID=UPI00286E6673|nr:type I-F CRISPR-associated endonuclease Cas1f [Gemmatimonas sp.]
MKQVPASDLKTVLHSKRANLYYLEHCRVLVNGGRVEYVTDEARRSLYWNIPIANTTTILLGTGTSITQAAVRELAKAGVMIGFCGGGGTPLFAGTEQQLEVAWFPAQSEYRPTEYLQNWASFWFDDTQRLAAAKLFQRDRLENVKKHWAGSKTLKDQGFSIDAATLDQAVDRAAAAIDAAHDQTVLLTEEARLTKELYKLASRATSYGTFTRVKRGDGVDPANRYLDHGNYLAYGLGATAAWVLGLPHSLAVLHGKTRRGGLVFDVADLVKDAVILPQAFLSAVKGHSEQEFRQACIEALTRSEALDTMIETLKSTSIALGRRRSEVPLPQAAEST